MMGDHLFFHGNGDPLSEGFPWKGIPLYSSPLPAEIRTTRIILVKPTPGTGDSPGTRGPQAKRSAMPSQAPSCSPRSREHARSHREAPSVPGSPSALHSPRRKRPDPHRRLTHPGNPRTHPAHAGSSHPHPRRWSPSPGFHPESPTGVLLHQPGGFSASSSASPPSGAAAAPPAPAALCGPRRLHQSPGQGHPAQEISSPQLPAPGYAQGGSRASSPKDASDGSRAPSPQTPGHRPHKPGEAASCGLGARVSPGGGGSHGRAAGAGRGGDARGGRGSGVRGLGGGWGTRLNRGARAEPTWPAGEE